MNPPDANRSVIEAESLRPRLRDDLHFHIQEQGDDRICVIEDRTAWRFHRVGLDEYAFIRALDGQRTLASILAQLVRDGGPAGFTENEALQIVRWLKDQHLLALESDRATKTDAASARQLLGALTWLNPLVARLPLARPDAFFARAAATLGWMLGRAGFLVWLGIVLSGAAAVAVEWPRFQRGFDGILARDNWLWLLLAWAALKLIHEFAHGLFCKHFGAAVREIGVIFVLFLPMGYVDASASLGLASKWRRIMVAAAGIYAEFFIAGLAALYWARSPDGLGATIAHNIIFTGTAVTLLLNANPLMRFDGYYILGDLLGLPNLATRGRAFTRGLIARTLLGRYAAPVALPRTRDAWITALYGITSALWQVLVFAGLLVAASTALRGGGLLFAALAGVLWLGVPLWQMGRATAQAQGSRTARLFTLIGRTAIIVGLGAALVLIPFRRSLSSPAVIELADTAVLRAECPGFVKAVHVRDGELVAADQLLVELTNDDVAASLDRARLDLEQQELRARIAYSKGELAAFQAETAKAETLRSGLAERQKFIATLQVRAPFAGRVTGRQLAQLPGTFLRSGDEVAQLGRAENSDVRIALDQEAAAHFRPAIGAPVEVRIEGRADTLEARLTRVEGRATRELIHPALTALAGGPLALRRAEDREQREGYELAEPHFVALAQLPMGLPQSGQLARARLRTAHGITLWESAQTAFARWLRRHTVRE